VEEEIVGRLGGEIVGLWDGGTVRGMKGKRKNSEDRIQRIIRARVRSRSRLRLGLGVRWVRVMEKGKLDVWT